MTVAVRRLPFECVTTGARPAQQLGGVDRKVGVEAATVAVVAALPCWKTLR